MAGKLYLVDGSGYIFRAYFALPRMSTSQGVPTQAIYGFTSMLLNIVQERPEGLVVAFEAPGPTFRNEIYPAYKANRPPVPEDLEVQYPVCMEVVEVLGVPALSVEGFEADDLIATMCRRSLDWGLEPWILSSDKDLMQLVGPGVHMMDPMKRREYGPEQVREKLGVPPDLVVDLLALAGDSSDNVPGVPGIGPKTAATLLARFGDLDTLLSRAHEVKGKRGEALRAHVEDVLLSRRLVTLRDDVPLEISKEDVTLGEPDWGNLRELLRRYEFRNLLERVPGSEPAHGSAEAARPGDDPLSGAELRAVTDPDDLARVVEAITEAGKVAVDTETTGKDASAARLVGISLAWDHHGAVYLPLAHQDGSPQLPMDEALAALAPLLEDPDLPKFGQNYKYDHQILAHLGVDMRGFVGDPMLASWLLDPDSKGHGLKALSMRHLGHRMVTYGEATEGLSEGQNFSHVPVDLAAGYAADDALVTLILGERLGEVIDREGLAKVYREVEVPLSRVLAKMEARGIAIDRELLEEMSRRFQERLELLEAECHALAGREFLIGSPKQLSEVLFRDLGLPAKKKTKTGMSTDQGVLEDLARLHPLPAKVLEYRHVAKLKNTYLDTLPGMIDPATGRIHTHFRQTGTATGRLSSVDPNLQNIPIRTEDGRRIRGAFVASPGHLLLSADYSQIELRVLAHLADEQALIDAFVAGEDIHRATAARIFDVLPGMVDDDQRRAAKAINFGIIYGMSAYRLAREQHMSRKRAQGFIDGYFQRYPRIKAWIQENLEQTRARGHTTTILGRRRKVPGLDDRSKVRRQAAERVATNTPIQGSAADIIKLAMLRLQELEDRGELPARMLLQVHDELVLEVPEAEAERAAGMIEEAMESVVELKVPLVVEVGVGRSWAEAH